MIIALELECKIQLVISLAVTLWLGIDFLLQALEESSECQILCILGTLSLFGIWLASLKAVVLWNEEVF